MAKTITQLPDATVVNDGDELIVQQSGITKRATKLEVIAGIKNASIASDAAIALSKLATGALPTAITVASANIVDGAVTAPKLADGGITAAKLDGAQTGSAPIYGCRAWVNFDGATVTNVGGENRCTIRGSGNVTKVVRNNTGSYAVHFTTAMPDANYATTAFAGNSAGNASLIQFGTTPTASSVVVSVVDNTFTGANRDVSVAIFR